jgi:hypothetical protein
MAAVCDLLTGDEILDTWLDNEWTGAPGSIVLDAELPAADIYGKLENARKINTMNSDHLERKLVKTLGKGRVNALNAQQLVAELGKANVGSETFVLS